MNIRFFNPAKSYQAHKLEYDAAIQDVLARGDLILRGDMETFEKNLAEYTGKKHAIAVNSGTDALYLSLWAMGIGEGDEVIVPSHTFVASVQVVEQLGATPVLVDVGDNLLMKSEVVLTSRTKAIIPVHLTGDVVQMGDKFIEEMHKHGIKIVEDAAQALGAKGVGKGDTQCYSFYPAKILGAFGDAGAITTDDDELAAELRELRNHYKKDYSKWGINSRLDNIQAAVLNIKMKYLAFNQSRRWQIALMYEKELKGIKGLRLPEYSSGRVFQDYIIRLDSKSQRDFLFEHLKRDGIETMKNEYPMPCIKMPNAKAIEEQTLRIPCNDTLEDEEIYEVIKSIKSYFVV